MKEIQKGLYLTTNSYCANGKLYITAILISGGGYCFYDTTEEYFDDEGNLLTNIKETERAYMTKNKVIMTSIEELNKTFISVPIREGFNVE